MAAPYDIYPAVDEEYNFPPEIRHAIADSDEMAQKYVAFNTSSTNLVTYAGGWPPRPNVPWPVTFRGPLVQQENIEDMRPGDEFVAITV